MWTIRQATAADLQTLTSLRLKFLREIGYADNDVEAAVEAYFKRTIPSGEFFAWIADAQEQAIGTAGLVFVQKPPHAKNLTGREALIMNMYTLPEYRRQGVATALLDALRYYVMQAGVTFLRLHTTVGATRVYRGQGFRSDRSDMVLHLGSE